MSQFYDQASLVMVPSGYKAGKVYSQKPLSTDGELTFTRNSNATRVNADGLVEKVRQNLALYSQDFSNAAWTKNNTAATVDTISNDTSNSIHRFYQATGPFTGTGELSFSIEFKYIDHQYISFGLTDDSNYRVQLVVDLINHTITNTELNAGTILLSSSFVSVGDGWYKLSGTINATSAWGNNIYALGVLLNGSTFTTATYLGTGTGVYIRKAQVEFGVNTDYIPTTSAAVSVGPTANVPRLDYSGGCPALKLEPQRTNNATFNERLASGTFSYVDGVTFTANSITAPTGYTQGCKFEKTGSGVADRYDALGGGPMSQSIFVKAGTSSRIVLAIEGNVTGSVIFDLSTLGITNYGTATGKIVDFGNGWYRCIANYSSTPTSGPITRIYLPDTGYLYCYGYQMELNASYETSLIPTLGASVTRLGDEIYKTGIASLIGQSEGTVFIDFEINSPDNSASKWIFFLKGVPGDYIGFYTNGSDKFIVEVAYLSATVFISASINVVLGQRYKMALGYKINDFALYVNGSQIATDSSGNVPACSSINYLYNTTTANVGATKHNQALLFKTRLSNQQLAEITAL